MPPAKEEKRVAQAATVESEPKSQASGARDESDNEEEEEEEGAEAAAGASDKKKKKKKKSKKKKAATSEGEPSAASSNPAAKLNDAQLQQLLALNPALSNEIKAEGSTAGAGNQNIIELLRQMNLQDILTGLPSGRSVKDMGAYKFWKTQPVPSFDEEVKEEGPMQVKTVDDVAKQPSPLPDGFEWVTMDLTDDGEMKEVHDLLEGHYVEDDTAMLRFNYSFSILKWALKAPGWKKDYHIGVRASQSRRLVAFISAIPVRLRVRQAVMTVSEVNFLVVHKKLRNKRLAPVLIKEVTRRSNLNGIWQGLYTGGTVLPTPVSTCRYYHRALDWMKLYEIGFSPLPPNSKPQHQVKRYALPDHGKLKGVREMRADDIDAVLPMLTKYLKRFDMAVVFDREEFEHWLLTTTQDRDERVVWSYVVEDDNGKITDFFSFYGLDSSVINHNKHKLLRAAYLFYYASETALVEPFDKPAFKKRLNELMHEALIFSKKLQFDVFNALTLMDNSLVLNEHHFGGGDGNLHYYLFNYKTAPVSGGVTKNNRPDEENTSGVGVVML